VLQTSVLCPSPVHSPGQLQRGSLFRDDSGGRFDGPATARGAPTATARTAVASRAVSAYSLGVCSGGVGSVGTPRSAADRASPPPSQRPSSQRGSAAQHHLAAHAAAASYGLSAAPSHHAPSASASAAFFSDLAALSARGCMANTAEPSSNAWTTAEWVSTAALEQPSQSPQFSPHCLSDGPERWGAPCHNHGANRASLSPHASLQLTEGVYGARMGSASPHAFDCLAAAAGAAPCAPASGGGGVWPDAARKQQQLQQHVQYSAEGGGTLRESKIAQDLATLAALALDERGQR
jgi:hypothetical protein